MVYILIAILIFGVLIAVHELGHFLAAKACGVRVNEFSIGMGPQLLHKTKGDTEYSLRLLPIGGYCAMEGEDEDSDDERALNRQAWWKKLIIFVAGAFMNFLTGLLIIVCLYAGAQGFYTSEIIELNPDFPQQGEEGLMPGDIIYAINGERVYLKSDVSLIMGLSDTGKIDMTVLRDGKKIERTLTKQVYTDENGKEYEAYGFTYGGIVKATPLLRLQYSWYQTMDYVRIVRMSLQMLFSGAAGVNDLSGPVGIVSQQYVRRQRVRKLQSAERYGLEPGQYGQVDRNVKPDALAGLGAHEQRTPAEIQFAQRPERPVLVEQSLFQSPPQNISVGAYRRQ